MIAPQTFFVRHGEMDRREGGLSPRGVSQAFKARDELIACGVDENAVILSSTIDRAETTARIILAGGVGRVLIASDQIKMASFIPDHIEDLDGLLSDILRENKEKTRQLVVVAHAPLLAEITGKHEDSISYGQVAEYTAYSWRDR